MTPRDVADLLAQAGGTCAARDLRPVCGRRALDRALTQSAILRVGRDRYCLPEIVESRKHAHRLAGTVGVLSAALLHGWPLLRQPNTPTVIVAPKRRIPAQRRREVNLQWRQLDPAEIVGDVTDPARTVLDCAAFLPFDEALAIADSALRCGDVTVAEIRERLPDGRHPRVRQMREVAAHMTADAASPPESALRAVAIRAGLSLQPQDEIALEDGALVHVDLGSAELRLAVEAESFQFHGHRAALHRDCRRYTQLACSGYRLLRYSWEDIMFDPTWITTTLRAACGLV